MADSIEASTLLIRNLPKNSDNFSIRCAFSEFGKIKNCFVVRDKNNYQQCSGNGYVTFINAEDATKCLKQTIKINEQIVSVKFSKKKPRNKFDPIKLDDLQASATDAADYIQKREREKQWKQKKARLIVRNLSFKLKKDDIENIFSEFGKVTDISVPTNHDGKTRGFAFVQYDTAKSATNAISGINLRVIEGRPVAVDFAVPKNQYDDNTDIEQPKQTEETLFNTLNDDPNYKNEDDHDEEMDDDDLQEMDDQSDESNSDSDSDLDSDSSSSQPSKKSKPRHKDQRPPEVNRGNTLFIRNISFMTTEEDFKESMSAFGQVTYALLCLDPQTEHPKGTGFVRFKTKEEADLCLKAAEDEAKGGIVLDGRRLLFSLALSREGATEKQAEHSKDKKAKDNRHLFLSREGLIRSGTEAAVGVSQSDMQKRQGLETRKKKLLRLLHFFVSDTRLVIYNLPDTIDDKKLKKMFLKAAVEPKAIVTEAKVMRNQNQVDEKGRARSKGFGFVTFKEHEHALEALRQLNNNPDIFNPKNRPIVEFSIENKRAVNKLERRKEKSNEPKNFKDKGSKLKADLPIQPSYSGTRSQEGVKNLPTHSGPKIRHKKRPETIKKKNKPAPIKQKTPPGGETPSKKAKLPPNWKQRKDMVEEVSFQRMVDKYKSNFKQTGDENISRTKWFD